jgi:hypothetical protein
MGWSSDLCGQLAEINVRKNIMNVNVFRWVRGRRTFGCLFAHYAASLFSTLPEDFFQGIMDVQADGNIPFLFLA